MRGRSALAPAALESERLVAVDPEGRLADKATALEARQAGEVELVAADRLDAGPVVVVEPHQSEAHAAGGDPPEHGREVMSLASLGGLDAEAVRALAHGRVPTDLISHDRLALVTSGVHHS